MLDGAPSPGVSLTSNIFGFGYYGIAGNSTGDGTATLNAFLPGWVFAGNLLAARPPGSSSPYPLGNAFPPSWASVQFVNFGTGNGGDYRLTTASPYISAGVGGSTPGVDMTTLNAATANVILGSTPAIVITSPTSAPTFTTSNRTLNLSGTASPAEGILQVTWFTDHGASGTATGTDAWTVGGIALQTGSNSITLTARDAFGSTASAVLMVTYTAPDTTPPTINITLPSSGPTFDTSNSTINLGGTALDNIGITRVTWSTDHGASGIAIGTTSWTINGLVLPIGSTRVAVATADAAGNPASAVLMVTYTAPLSATTTILTTTAPAPVPFGQAIPLSANVSGTATGTVIFKDGTVVLGTSTLSGGIATFKAKRLAAGSHNFTATYKGDAQNAASTSNTLSVIISARAARV
jgi:hypothetical protein